jgi:hypothetical protein
MTQQPFQETMLAMLAVRRQLGQASHQRGYQRKGTHTIPTKHVKTMFPDALLLQHCGML